MKAEPVRVVITSSGTPHPSYGKIHSGSAKNLVLVDGVPILARALSSYGQPNPEHTTVVLSADEDMKFPTRQVISEYFPELRVLTSKAVASGALIAAILGTSDLPELAPLVIAGGDSEIRGGIAGHIEKFGGQDCAAGVIVFPDNHERWSYIQLGESKEILQVSEKVVVGPYATTGVFFFRSVALFRDAAEWCLVNNATTNGAFYVSTALNYLITRGETVLYDVIEPDVYKNYKFAEDTLAARQ
jgi:hypothetical protein